ncbi:16S rRNA (uracil(1498)-N(3))-methyltransferase [Poseidonibacter ostreae]|jgi:16S rRNA (uracil1498-N3)-methyltransferase|uniref:Ribosomal RNA small subunit methyltransferase E n=1 Tax=Poseidonibacter ostreae TaxID=2654171 RepID=A0A6L4WSL2_9BACT|nr:16S rRNA (uracil(1498)-N(3))-methyltransferase [Poseidonibacter ostreae]KAB7887956.1 16S rRNA (uracil(1498)-N(3))-methyltransferase [Poseidonibacter ostreae]KAB7888728.1 16S rRNA (uracil(1498)-N(3))-methyltransferase [Poseidonibacter ostreae]KAB7892446.1 16S rRNA (uracil(1498)-N(3))-methyltransferase [Poseidonibacter ostreae]MAC84673.1 16S rRNA (uracil(1498)-N(3))-methyltransferase [Arcobacter sp.]|tara:strand:+ start:4465 stop:5136 length:672 start_codon:yes stop_codon:yes gene_type:complete
MQFTYDINCGASNLEISEDTYKYLIKARRHKINDEIYFRNLNDNLIYLYKLISISRRSAIFSLISSEEKEVENKKDLHLGWCLVDPKTVEKYLASLNELGVSKITFIFCEYSQKNFKLNIEKLEKILINSSSQCGRSSIIKLETCDSLEQFVKENEDTYFLDFSKTFVDEKKDDIKTLVIGCEGGFSSDERFTFNKDNIVGFDSSLILRSETAVIGASSKILI